MIHGFLDSVQAQQFSLPASFGTQTASNGGLEPEEKYGLPGNASGVDLMKHAVQRRATARCRGDAAPRAFGGREHPNLGSMSGACKNRNI